MALYSCKLIIHLISFISFHSAVWCRREFMLLGNCKYNVIIFFIFVNKFLLILYLQRIKGDTTITKFSSRRKSSEVLNKKKKLKNLDIGKYGFNDGSMIYINESLCPYYRELLGKYKDLWQDKVIASFYTINGILSVEKSEYDKSIITY